MINKIRNLALIYFTALLILEICGNSLLVSYLFSGASLAIIYLLESRVSKEKREITSRALRSLEKLLYVNTAMPYVSSHECELAHTDAREVIQEARRLGIDYLENIDK